MNFKEELIKKTQFYIRYFEIISATNINFKDFSEAFGIYSKYRKRPILKEEIEKLRQLLLIAPVVITNENQEKIYNKSITVLAMLNTESETKKR